MPDPFEPIPPEAAVVLRPVLEPLSDEIIAAIAAEVPDYARAMVGPFGQAVRFGVERALGRFVDGLADPTAPDRGARDETYVELGRGELRGGRSLDALLAAYRVGARLAWRRFVEAGVAAGLAPAVLYRLGEAIFAYIDAISAESAEGYAEEQSAAAGERQRRRRALVRLLAAQPAADEEAIRSAAGAAGWALPREVAAAVVAGGEEGELDADAQRLARRIDPGAVGGVVEDAACVLVPDPDAPTRRRHIARALAGHPAALGPTVSWPDSGASVRRALAAARLVASGRLEASGLVVADEHLPQLALHADPSLATALAERGLAPLRGETGAERLTETLRAWLDRPGQVQAVAAVLGVHPQTVRYRLKRLRELYRRSARRPGGAPRAVPRAARGQPRCAICLNPMRLLVTGAAGMLGQDVVAAALAAGHDVTALARRDLDITDPDAVAATVAAARPDAIVNCAAWTDVDGAEADPDAALRHNGDSMGHLGRTAADAGAHLVHVSTDYVFDGRATRPYVESDPTGPLSAYGRSKLAGERALDLDRAAVVRASWLFGAGGRNFVATMLRLAGDRDEVTVVDDQVGFPTYTGHLAPELLRLAQERATGILHAVGPEPCSWHDFAVEIFARAGVSCAVRRGRTADLGLPAPRPAYSVLGTERADAPRLAPWRDGLAAYIDEIKVTQT